MEANVKSLKYRPSRRAKEELNGLVASIEELGVLEPVVINRAREVISGRRRLEAARQAGLSRVPVVQFNGPALQEELARIDANLQVLPLGKPEFDTALLRRKEIWEALHPETRQHVAGGKRSKTSFARQTARRLGVSRRTIEKAVTRAKRVAPQVRGKLSPSKVDELAKLPTQMHNALAPLLADHSLAAVREAVKIAKRKGVKPAKKFLRTGDHYLHLVDAGAEKLLSLLRAGNRGLVKYDIAGSPPVLSHLRALRTEIDRFLTTHKPLEAAA